MKKQGMIEVVIWVKEDEASREILLHHANVIAARLRTADYVKDIRITICSSTSESLHYIGDSQ